MGSFRQEAGGVDKLVEEGVAVWAPERLAKSWRTQNRQAREKNRLPQLSKP